MKSRTVHSTSYSPQFQDAIEEMAHLIWSEARGEDQKLYTLS